ncbi:hypothetical protein AOX55_00005833 (plasmid) [Sinorhizobium fredii CCBAU 25509]|nr:hypothetical protein AOX55_00005833 [Sinorhizobium fredii CCBAU 25509]
MLEELLLRRARCTIDQNDFAVSVINLLVKRAQALQRIFGAVMRADHN